MSSNSPFQLIPFMNSCSVITFPHPSRPRDLLPFIKSSDDVQHSHISASHNLNSSPFVSFSYFSIVFQFRMMPPKRAPSKKVFQASLVDLKNSRLICLSLPLSPSFSCGLSQGQEFRVDCLPEIDHMTSDRQLWGVIVDSGEPKLNRGFTAAYMQMLMCCCCAPNMAM